MTNHYTLETYDDTDCACAEPFCGTEEEVIAEACKQSLRNSPVRVYSNDDEYVGYAVWGEYFNANDCDDDTDWEDEWDDEPYDPFDEVGYNPYLGSYDPDC